MKCQRLPRGPGPYLSWAHDAPCDEAKAALAVLNRALPGVAARLAGTDDDSHRLACGFAYRLTAAIEQGERGQTTEVCPLGTLGALRRLADLCAKHGMDAASPPDAIPAPMALYVARADEFAEGIDAARAILAKAAV